MALIINLQTDVVCAQRYSKVLRGWRKRKKETEPPRCQVAICSVKSKKTYNKNTHFLPVFMGLPSMSSTRKEIEDCINKEGLEHGYPGFTTL